MEVFIVLVPLAFVVLAVMAIGPLYLEYWWDGGHTRSAYFKKDEDGKEHWRG